MPIGVNIIITLRFKCNFPHLNDKLRNNWLLFDKNSYKDNVL